VRVRGEGRDLSSRQTQDVAKDMEIVSFIYAGAPEKIKMRTFRVGLFGCRTH
jgi:hypothetical protein